MKTFVMVLLAFFSVNAFAGETITSRDILSADKVMSRNDKIKNVGAAIGGTFGALAGYSYGISVGLTGTALVGPTVATSLLYAGYVYGAAALGERLGVKWAARDIRADMASAGEYLEREGKKLQTIH
jgi:hypothetical protein